MRWIRSSLLLATLAVAACSGGSSTVTPPPPPPTPTVDHVVIDNGNFTSIVGETRQLQVRALTATGDLVTSATVSYASSATAVATVSTTGLVTAVAPGVTTISATSAGKTASVTVTVTLPAVASISVVLQRQVIKTNDTTRVVATLRDASNNILPNRIVNWQSSDSTTVLVGQTGFIFGLRPGGPITITGSIDGLTASVTILVTPALVGSVRIIPDSAVISPDSTMQFRVEVLDEFGGTVDSAQVIWASVQAQIASVSPDGLVRGVQLGDTRILATVGGVTGEAFVTVALPEVAKFRISIDNRLRYPVVITQNDVPIGQASANSITTIERPMTEHAVFAWSLIRPGSINGSGGFGEALRGVLPDIANPTGTITMTVTNVLADGRVYFNPRIRDLTPDKVWLKFPVVDQAVPCACAASPFELTSREYGYWLLTPASVLEVYRISDPGMTGTKLTFPVPIGDVEAMTGVWQFDLLIAP